MAKRYHEKTHHYQNTDKQAQVDTLHSLLPLCKSDFQQIAVYNTLIPARFDLPSPPFSASLADITTLYTLLSANQHISIGPAEDTPLITLDKEASAGDAVVVRGNVESFVDRLDEEYLKELQAIEGHSVAYLKKLGEEAAVYAVLVTAKDYAELKEAERVVVDGLLMRRVEHLYYKVPYIRSIPKDLDLSLGLAKERTNDSQYHQLPKLNLPRTP